MAEKKKQHYIPQFYLKLFSIHSAGTALAIYNIPSRKFIPNAKLKNQACRNYFYGSNLNNENNLAIIESHSSSVIKKIIANNAPPIQLSEEHHTILTFATFLKNRTVYAADQQDELVDKLLKKAYGQHPLVRDNIDKFHIHLTDPIGTILSTAALNLPIAFDLAIKVIRNDTPKAFIISDNPVVFYNQFLEQRKKSGGITGLACKGLQILLPLSPHHYLIFYDSEVYGIGGQQASISINNASDILALNSLQFISAKENLFFDHTVTNSDIKTIQTNAQRYRQPIKGHVDEYIGRSNHDRYHTLLHSYKQEIKCDLVLSFVSLLPAAQKYQLGNKAVHVRNDNICHLHQQFIILVEKGFYLASQFPSFLAQIEIDPDFFTRHNIILDSD